MQKNYTRGMTTTLYHGTYSADMALHRGLCLTDDWNAAFRYAEQYRETDPAPTVHVVEVAMDDLTVLEVAETWDSQPETATEDAARFADHGTGAYPGVDVLIYQDYAMGLEQMTTYRLLTDRAVAVARITGHEEI
jgi:hypothetical protein